jgi:hypothetical protein
MTAIRRSVLFAFALDLKSHSLNEPQRTNPMGTMEENSKRLCVHIALYMELPI